MGWRRQGRWHRRRCLMKRVDIFRRRGWEERVYVLVRGRRNGGVERRLGCLVVGVVHFCWDLGRQWKTNETNVMCVFW